jgi:hypothetical protein
MRDDREDHVFVLANQKIEAPAPIYSGLPNIVCLIVFLRSQRWMRQLVEQETRFVWQTLSAPLEAALRNPYRRAQ